jgi:hypothetical protein
MTDQGFRFCPRCGTARAEGMRYCGNCGFDVAGLSVASTDIEPVSGTARSIAREPAPQPRGFAGGPIIIAAVIVAAGLIGFALLGRSPSSDGGRIPPGVTSAAGSLPPGATAMPSAPIVGMTIQSPRDGEQLSTKDVTVIGLAPPGLRITRDVSLRPDQHATADSTGHWAIAITLDEGDNTLVFRIGDDRSTEQRIRVTYTPPSG